MLEESTVTSKHQVTIPKRIREQTGIEVGDTLLFEAQGDHVLVRRKGVSRLAAELPLAHRGKPVVDVHEWREIAKRKASEDAV